LREDDKHSDKHNIYMQNKQKSTHTRTYIHAHKKLKQSNNYHQKLGAKASKAKHRQCYINIAIPDQDVANKSSKRRNTNKRIDS
jgi:hypothetical protein